MKQEIDQQSRLPFESDISENQREFDEPLHLDTGNHRTAREAARILIETDPSFVIPSQKERRSIIAAFATYNYLIYGKVFDIVKVNGNLDLSEVDSISKNLHKIRLFEIKSTKKKGVGSNFDRHFFSISTAELLVAQSLKEKYGFIFVNINTREIREMKLREIFSRAKGIYPYWSIQF